MSAQRTSPPLLRRAIKNPQMVLMSAPCFTLSFRKLLPVRFFPVCNAEDIPITPHLATPSPSRPHPPTPPFQPQPRQSRCCSMVHHRPHSPSSCKPLRNSCQVASSAKLKSATALSATPVKRQTPFRRLPPTSQLGYLPNDARPPCTWSLSRRILDESPTSSTGTSYGLAPSCNSFPKNLVVLPATPHSAQPPHTSCSPPLSSLPSTLEPLYGTAF